MHSWLRRMSADDPISMKETPTSRGSPTLTYSLRARLSYLLIVTQHDIGHLLDELYQPGVIKIAITRGFHRAHHLRDLACNHQRYAVFESGPECNLHVLFV